MNGRARSAATAPTPRKEGFADVARWIALDPDGETSIYRKFGELRARNLLYHQARLSSLEKRLSRYDEEDAANEGLDVKDAARTWETLEKQWAAGDEAAHARVQLLDEIDTALRTYSEVLLLHNEVAKLKRPSERVLGAYRHWFKKPHPALGGVAKTFLDDDKDLVSVGGSAETDYFSSFLRRHWPVQEDEHSRDGVHRIGRFSEASIAITVAGVSIGTAAILLVGPIVGLYIVVSDFVRLAMIVVFTAAFALSVGLMTNARRAEIFGATAAYAAVLVVFVSGNLSNSPSNKGS